MESKTVWELKDPSKKAAPTEMKFKVKARNPQQQKNPAVAFSLSMLVWGGGQVYNRQWKLGGLFILLMANFYMYLLIGLMFWRYQISSFITNHVSTFAIFIACGIFYLSGMAFWIFNAVHAYYHAMKSRNQRYEGTEIPFLPPLCSFLVPGWGQFLNGQAKKGSLFLVIATAGLSAIPILFIFPALWPTLETLTQRLYLEWILVVVLFLTPLFLFAWLLSIFDSIKVYLDDIKKSSLRERVSCAINRIRMQGVVHGVMPQAKLTLMLSLVLTLSIAFSYFFFPKQYYATILHKMQTRMSKQEMVLIPSLANRFFNVTWPEERNPEVLPEEPGLNL